MSVDNLFGYEEKAIIALCLRDCSVYSTVSSVLEKSDFKVVECSFLFEVFSVFVENGQSWTWEAIVDHVSNMEKKPGELQQSVIYLSELAALSFSKDNLGKYIGCLLERRNRQLLVQEITSFQESIVDHSISFESLMVKCGQLGSSLSGLGLSLIRDVNSDNLWTELKKDLTRMQSVQFVGTGFDVIDNHLTWGFAPGQLSLIAGRPSAGKSLFRSHIQCYLAGVGIHTITISKEQSVLSEYMRLIAMMSGVPLKRLLSVHLWDQYREDEYAEMSQGFEQALHKMQSNWPHRLIRPHGYFGLKDVERYILDSQNRGDEPKVVFIDLFAQLNDVNIEKPQQIEKKIMEAAEMAVKYNVNVCLVVQFSRHGKDREKVDHREKFKGSGGYEERADLAFEIERPAHYNPNEIEDNRMTVRILKQREGPTPTLALGFDAPVMKIYDLNDPMLRSDKDEDALKRFGGFKTRRKR